LHSFIIQIAADAAGAIYLQWVLVTGHAELWQFLGSRSASKCITVVGCRSGTCLFGWRSLHHNKI
jgi:hypothetical protein